MAIDHETKPTSALLPSSHRCQNRRRVFLRRRKLLTVRLGGNRPGRGHVLLRILRRMKLKWLKLRYLRMLKKLKQYYRGLVKDLIEAGATLEAYQQRLVMEASLGAPVMGVTFSSFPYALSGSDRRSYFF